MAGIASFMRVSRSQFEADWREHFFSIPPWDALRTPRRATYGSAGYDFFAPADFMLDREATLTIPTGFRARIDPGWVLLLFPRSGLGFKYRMMLSNTVGVIDSDYFDARNEGHILIKLYNAGDSVLSVKAGEAFAQGVFLPYGITDDDRADGKRIGGFGSTGGML